MPGWHGLSSKVAIPVRQSYAGDHAHSLLYQRVVAGEMPPGEKKLTPAQIDVLARWIDQGARTAHEEPASLPPGNTFSDEERNHWSFQPIRRPPLPEVRSPALVRSPIDAFLLAALEAKGLSFGPPADRPALIRRLYFDLTGLPPSPSAVERFVNDPVARRLRANWSTSCSPRPAMASTGDAIGWTSSVTPTAMATAEWIRPANGLTGIATT